jgi:hypothetical protein
MANSASYNPPGVRVEEQGSAIVPAPIALSDIVAIVSEVPASQPGFEVIKFNDNDDDVTANAAVALSKVGIVTGSIKIRSFDGSAAYENSDFTVTSSGANDYTSTKSITRVTRSATVTTDFTSSVDTYTIPAANARGVHDIKLVDGDDNVYDEYVDWTFDRFNNRIKRLATGTLPNDGTDITISYRYGIEDTETVVVEYQYANADYYEQRLFVELEEVFAAFGAPFNPNGTPNPVSLMAQMVFSNGGPNTMVRIVPVNPHRTDVTKTVPNLADWQLAIEDIDVEGVSTILETKGHVETQGAIIQFVQGEYNNGYSMMTYLGRDGTVESLNATVLGNYAEAINSERVVLVSGCIDGKMTTLDTFSTSGDVTRIVGEQYAAGALAGGFTNIKIYETMTRKGIAGIRVPKSVKVPLLNNAAASGICVIENREGFMRVRHAITTASADINKREISVIRSKDFIVRSLKDMLDRAVIGMPITASTEFLVQAAATSVLDRMAIGQVLDRYNDPQVSRDATDPTRLILRFSYLPTYPLNEILVIFNISSLGVTLAA